MTERPVDGEPSVASTDPEPSLDDPLPRVADSAQVEPPAVFALLRELFPHLDPRVVVRVLDLAVGQEQDQEPPALGGRS
jgi:hypothetical protein